jgi:hypothetical protein
LAIKRPPLAGASSAQRSAPARKDREEGRSGARRTTQEGSLDEHAVRISSADFEQLHRQEDTLPKPHRKIEPPLLHHGVPDFGTLAQNLLSPLDLLGLARDQVAFAEKILRAPGRRFIAIGEMEMCGRLDDIQLDIVEISHKLRLLAEAALNAPKARKLAATGKIKRPDVH